MYSLRVNNSNTYVTYAVYGASSTHHNSYLMGLCDDDRIPRGQSWASDVYIEHIPLREYVGTRIVNGETNYIYSSRIDAFYAVRKEGWYNVVFQFCYWSKLFDPVSAPSVAPTYQPTLFNGTSMVNSSVPSASLSNSSSHVDAGSSLSGMGDYDDLEDDYNEMILVSESYAVADGQVSFKNPYGYLPAGLFGVLPYQVCCRVVK